MLILTRVNAICTVWTVRMVPLSSLFVSSQGPSCHSDKESVKGAFDSFRFCSLAARLLELQKLREEAKKITGEEESPVAVYDLEDSTAAAAMVAVRTVQATRSKVSLRQRPLQLLLITEQPSEEREFHIEPQWED
ncbi:hypothetical protein HAX54_023241 [Datura stramonium]|uniref:Uncharacterized protein n=1 Tax=Datura stramonium TaxID=4076 RepID=A0ABS8UX50_DATST|nr:hypothetical protein [Datura stramonium]